MIADHKAYTRNLFVSRAHKFCSATMNWTSKGMTDDEEASFNTCMVKYKNAYGMFSKEQSLFNAQCAKLKENGQDKFEAFSIV